MAKIFDEFNHVSCEIKKKSKELSSFNECRPNAPPRKRGRTEFLDADVLQVFPGDVCQVVDAVVALVHQCLVVVLQVEESQPARHITLQHTYTSLYNTRTHHSTTHVHITLQHTYTPLYNTHTYIPYITLQHTYTYSIHHSTTQVHIFNTSVGMHHIQNYTCYTWNYIAVIHTNVTVGTTT